MHGKHKNHKKDVLGIMGSMSGTAFTLSGMMSDLISGPVPMSVIATDWESVALLWVETFGLTYEDKLSCF